MPENNPHYKGSPMFWVEDNYTILANGVSRHSAVIRLHHRNSTEIVQIKNRPGAYAIYIQAFLQRI